MPGIRKVGCVGGREDRRTCCSHPEIANLRGKCALSGRRAPTSSHTPLSANRQGWDRGGAEPSEPRPHLSRPSLRPARARPPPVPGAPGPPPPRRAQTNLATPRLAVAVAATGRAREQVIPSRPTLQLSRKRRLRPEPCARETLAGQPLPGPAPPGARRHAAREQAARPGPLLSPRSCGDQLQPGPSHLAQGPTSDRPTPSLRAQPRQRHPPRAGGAHAAAKVSADSGARGPDVPKALPTLAVATALICGSPNPVFHLTHLGLCLG